ncbi:MAG: ribonuclease R, partial [Pseudomonadota bacterium]
KLDETGADGLVPIRELGNEYFHYDSEALTLTGSDTGREIGLGQRVTVRLAEATPVTGGLILELLDIDGQRPSKGPQRRAKPPKRKMRAGKKKAEKARKVTRRRR